MSLPDFIPGDGPCVLADGVAFVPGMPLWYRSPLGEPQALQTADWQAAQVIRWSTGNELATRPYTDADMEWALFLPGGGMAGVAALFVSRPVGRIPECL